MDEESVKHMKTSKVLNKTKKNNYAAFRPISNSTLNLLQEFYAPFNEKLAKMLNNDGFKWTNQLYSNTKRQ
jgi:hypothetical protein